MDLISGTILQTLALFTRPVQYTRGSITRTVNIATAAKSDVKGSGTPLIGDLENVLMIITVSVPQLEEVGFNPPLMYDRLLVDGATIVVDRITFEYSGGRATLARLYCSGGPARTAGAT